MSLVVDVRRIINVECDSHDIPVPCKPHDETVLIQKAAAMHLLVMILKRYF
jgi:hypothetical protein